MPGGCLNCGTAYVLLGGVLLLYIAQVVTTYSWQAEQGGISCLLTGWVVCASAPLDRQLQYAAMLRSCLNVCAQLLLLQLLLQLQLPLLLRMSWQRDGDAVEGKAYRVWQKKLLHQLSTANCIDFYTL